MQRPIEEIKRRLLTCIDQDYNVTDMAACLELITVLERTPITREVLESTRLGKHINDIRRKTTNQDLYRRAKDLVRKWRKDVLADGVNGATASGPGPGGTGTAGPPGVGTKGNGHPPTSPSSLPSSANTSPGMSMPTTPSTLAQRTRVGSPTLTTSHSSRPVKPASPALLRGRVLSPGSSPVVGSSPAITPPLARPRSRPHSPAINPNRQPLRADASSYAPSTENVAKTNTANKRLRKDEDESSSDIPVAKRPRNSVTNGFDEDSKDSFSSVLSNDCNMKLVSGMSDNKPRRIANTNTISKKRSVLDPPVASTMDNVKQKMPSVTMATKGSKVKTTSQIVAELAERKGDTKLKERASKLEEQQVRELPVSGGNTGGRGDQAAITRNKMDHLHRFLSSQGGPVYDDLAGEDDRASISSDHGQNAPLSPPVPEAPPPIVMTPSNLDLLGVREDESAEEILARLKPIDHSTIVWSEEEEDVQGSPKEAGESEDSGSEDEVEKLVQLSKQVPTEQIDKLHSNNLDCQNGNFDMDGKFREWHEVINKKAYQDDPLVILPYVITDF